MRLRVSCVRTAAADARSLGLAQPQGDSSSACAASESARLADDPGGAPHARAAFEDAPPKATVSSASKAALAAFADSESSESIASTRATHPLAARSASARSMRACTTSSVGLTRRSRTRPDARVERVHGARHAAASSSELLASRLAPCTPVYAFSPHANRPSTDVAPCRSVTTPPHR